MSFLNNANARVSQKNQPSDRGGRSDAPESAFGADLLQSSPESDTSAARVTSPYSSDRPPSFAAPATSSGPTPPEKCTNILAAGAKWNGTLSVEDSVRIDGQFTGEVDAKGTIHVAEGAQVDAKVRASYVVVSGEFRGEIRCDERTELMPRSRVTAEVMTKVLSVHEGATWDGSVKMSGGADFDRGRSAARLSRLTGTEAADVATAASAERRAERVASAAPMTNGRGNQPEA